MGSHYYDPVTRQKGPGLFRLVGLGCAGVVGVLVVIVIVASLSAGAARSPSSTTTLVATSPIPTAPPDKSKAVYIDPRLIAADPQKYVGQNVIVQGRAGNVQQQDAPFNREPYTWIDFGASIRGRQYDTESIVVEMVPQVPSIVRNDCYRVYGIVGGTTTVQTVLTGATHEAPVVRGYTWQPVPGSELICTPP